MVNMSETKQEPTNKQTSEIYNNASSYNPYEHRNTEFGNNYYQGLANMIKGAIGTGILAMPQAYKYAGTVGGSIGGLMIGILVIYSLHLLIDVQYRLCKLYRVPHMSYSESVRNALQIGPSWARHKHIKQCLPIIVDVFLIIYQLGVMSAYVIFVATNLQCVINAYATNDLDIRYYVLTVYIPFALINFLPNLKVLSYFAIVANLLSIVSFAMSGIYIFKNMPPLDERSLIEVKTFPLYVGTFLFSLNSIGLVLAIEADMKQPKQFTMGFGVLNVSMVYVMVLYLVFGFLGYWQYGDEALGSITLNFDETDLMANLIRIFYTIAIYITYALHSYVPVAIIWDNYLQQNKENKAQSMKYLLRFVFTTITVIVAAFIPHIGIVISLTGSFSLTSLAFMVPGLLEICINYSQSYGRFKYRLFVDLLIILCGIIGFATGTYSAIDELVYILNNPNEVNNIMCNHR